MSKHGCALIMLTNDLADVEVEVVLMLATIQWTCEHCC